MVSFEGVVKEVAISFHCINLKICHSLLCRNTSKKSILKSKNSKRKNTNTQNTKKVKTVKKEKKRKKIIQYFVMSKTNHPKKKSYAIPPCLKRSGSLTVEAAMVVPIFLFFCYLMIQVINVTKVQQQVQCCLEVTGDTMAGLGVTPTVGEAYTIFLSNISKSNVNMKYIDHKVLGVSLANSKISQDDCLDLQVNYKIIFTNISGKKLNITCRQKVYRKCFTGKSICNSEDSEYVYITTGDAVYHTNRYCTHLVLSITQVSKESIKKQKKYKACRKCRKMKNPGWYYVTNQGGKYHNSLLCSGLKRTIERVKKSEVTNRRLCSRCEKKGG